MCLFSLWVIDTHTQKSSGLVEQRQEAKRTLKSYTEMAANFKIKTSCHRAGVAGKQLSQSYYTNHHTTVHRSGLCLKSSEQKQGAGGACFLPILLI